MITPISLGTWPTPAEPAPRLAARLGLDALWFKRDDLGGLGGGGNKVRKLQYTCAQALAAGATTLITTGAAQSNHARLTAAAAARLGLRCVLVLAGAPEDRPGGNLILNALAGAEVVWAGDRPTAEVVEERRGDAFVIPFGGSSPDSVPAYAECAREIAGQVPGFDAVVVALGSGATMAGLVRGLGPDRVVGVDTGALADPGPVVAGLLGGAVDPGALRIDRTQVGPGYGVLTGAVREALEVTARTEGIFLDPTYTGRAMAGLIRERYGPRIVFLHTGGLPALFSPPPPEGPAAAAT
jgi:L-cysteate sulfo-lyase